MMVFFACGHGQRISARLNATPTCLTCGIRRVSHVTDGEKKGTDGQWIPGNDEVVPMIHGHATGPHVETTDLGPIAVQLATGPSLTLKTPKE
jgi:hypothetical protein